MECPICNGSGILPEQVSKGYDHSGLPAEICDFCCGNGYIVLSAQDEPQDYQH